MNKYMKIAKELSEDNLKTNVGGPFGACIVLYTSCYPCPMCLSAIIWSNIKKVYYGNTKEDAANIGFRDDYIYSYIKSLTDNTNDNSVLKLECIDREETIETFNQFIEKSDKTIY